MADSSKVFISLARLKTAVDLILERLDSKIENLTVLIDQKIAENAGMSPEDKASFEMMKGLLMPRFYGVADEHFNVVFKRDNGMSSFVIPSACYSFDSDPAEIPALDGGCSRCTMRFVPVVDGDRGLDFLCEGGSVAFSIAATYYHFVDQQGDDPHGSDAQRCSFGLSSALNADGGLDFFWADGSNAFSVCHTSYEFVGGLQND